MKYVLDSSVGFKWVVREADSDKALRLRDEYRSAVTHLLAPEFYPFEVAHAVTRAERQGRITTAQGAIAIGSLLRHLPELVSVLPFLSKAYTISSQTRVGVFDCLYVALAEREGCELVTADTRLLNSLEKQYPFVIPLSSL
jgi:predicted nucleic acid-binding protein